MRGPLDIILRMVTGNTSTVSELGLPITCGGILGLLERERIYHRLGLPDMVLVSRSPH
jgi:hypothetical protein